MNAATGFQNPQIKVQRQKKRTFYVLLAMFVVLVVFNIVGGGPVHGCFVPMAAVVGLLAAVHGAEVYFNSSRRVVRPELLYQELEWLVGKDYIQTAAPRIISFAHERIRQRRFRRWRYMLLSIPI